MSDFSNYFSDDSEDFGGKIIKRNAKHKRQITFREPNLSKNKHKNVKRKRIHKTVNLRKIRSPLLRAARKKRMISFIGGEDMGGCCDSIGGEYFDDGYFGGALKIMKKKSSKSNRSASMKLVGSKTQKRKPTKYNMFVKKMMPYVIDKYPRSTQASRMKHVARLWAAHKRKNGY